MARVMIVACVGTWMMVLGLSTRTWDSFQGLTGLASTREVFLEEVSGPHTYEVIKLIYFSHYTTIHYSVFTITWLYTLTHSLIIFFTCSSLVFLRFLTYLLTSLSTIDHWRSRCKGRISGPSFLHTYLLTAPSELSFYIRSDDVIASRTFYV
jgi:hypothetical protein